ncbi:hypothetical protein [Mycobacterium sp. GA-1841]|uniref:hypothetical protein n=1 Tax=Mycobacterium sp. GA-1841 TaxID=1834154 RepID=UPI0011156EA2|nr:hypothetical protein [Mycobacterium sp. GA-1841]
MANDLLLSQSVFQQFRRPADRPIAIRRAVRRNMRDGGKVRQIPRLIDQVHPAAWSKTTISLDPDPPGNFPGRESRWQSADRSLNARVMLGGTNDRASAGAAPTELLGVVVLLRQF